VKLSKVQPLAFRGEYANLLPLALANGSFECHPTMIWSDVYSFNRPDITPEIVVAILDELERVKLLFRWKAEDGVVWGYWVGIEKPGRLPGRSRWGVNEKVGAEPPAEELAAFLQVHCNQRIPMESAPKPKPEPKPEHKPEPEPEPEHKPKPGEEIFWQGQILVVTKRVDAALDSAYPQIDRLPQYARADAWLVANPAKRKKDFGRFINNWFGRAQNDLDRQNLRGVSGYGRLSKGEQHTQDVIRSFRRAAENLTKTAGRDCGDVGGESERGENDAPTSGPRGPSVQ
jgi:hypothetical protein